MLLAGGGTKFDVEAASAAATITDTVLGINSSDTLLGDGVSVLSGIEVTARGLAFLPIFHFEIGNLYSRDK